MIRPWTIILTLTALTALTAAAAPAAPAAADSAAAAVESAEDAGVGVRAAEPPTAPMLVAPRVKPTLAVVMSAPMPGWGQLHADNGWRAVLAWGAQAFYLGNMLAHDRQAVRLRTWTRSMPESDRRDLFDARVEEEWELMRDYAWWSMGAMLIIALDAYVGAHLHNFDEDPLPVPDLWDPAGEPLPIERSDAGRDVGVVLVQWRAAF